jgi:hypothetical protein
MNDARFGTSPCKLASKREREYVRYARQPQGARQIDWTNGAGGHKVALGWPEDDQSSSHMTGRCLETVGLFIHSSETLLRLNTTMLVLRRPSITR